MDLEYLPTSAQKRKPSGQTLGATPRYSWRMGLSGSASHIEMDMKWHEYLATPKKELPKSVKPINSNKSQ